MVKKKGMRAFTLIELIAVLVIMAILALIVTPLVMNIIRKARIAADKRSIDAYGRSIELAIAGYLLDTGKFPTSIDQLSIEYSGDEVVCSTTQLNDDSSVYLTGCTVKGRTVDYTYGEDKLPKTYSVGDEVTYNGVDYYVIKNSGPDDTSLTLIKQEPFTVEEVNLYGGVGTDHNRVNRYIASPYPWNTYVNGETIDKNGYGAIAYISNETCGYVNNNSVNSGCTFDYDKSDVKYVIDAWAKDNTIEKDLVADYTGYSARIITMDDLLNDLGYSWSITSGGAGQYPEPNENVPEFVYSNATLTMSPREDSDRFLWQIKAYGGLWDDADFTSLTVIRPIITINKNVLK